MDILFQRRGVLRLIRAGEDEPRGSDGDERSLEEDKSYALSKRRVSDYHV